MNDPNESFRLGNTTFDHTQWVWIILCLIMLSFVGLCVVCWVSDIYRLLPGWGPVRKFDASGNEDMRQRQVQIHQHAEALQASYLKAAEEPTYGAIGRPTWGVCESPNKHEIPFHHPQLGEVKMREDFPETQKMREQCDWWSKDEPHYMAEKGLHAPPLKVNAPYSKYCHR